MKLKNNIFTALLLAIGVVLHYITPGILGGMKFDFLLGFMFVALLINPNFQNILLSGFLAGMLSAITTSFPGGQVPNMIDKIFTCLILFGVIKIIYNENINPLLVALIGGLGTFISGIIFLTSASFIVGLPAPIGFLISTVVIPTTIVNAIGTAIIYKMVNTSLRLSKVKLDKL